METAAEVLLIIVSSVLAIFLVILIIAGVYLIRVLREAHRLAVKAEDAVQRVESAASTLGRTLSPVAAWKLIGGIFNQGSRDRRKKG